MNILVTNDDGIESKGLWALAKAMSRAGQVTIIAPDIERSGVGSCLSFRSDIGICKVESEIPGVSAFALGGTPSDCVMLGMNRTGEDKFDLVVSGINPGPNIGRDIPYSGTVMATLQGYYGNIPSLAVSLFPQKRDEELDFNFAAEVAEKLAVNIKNGKLKTNAVLNVNVPNIPRQKIKGILITRTADTGYVKPSRIQGEKMMKYTLVPDYSRFGAIAENTDLWAINAGYISISPLRFEPTHHESIPSIKKCVQTMEGEFWENARF